MRKFEMGTLIRSLCAISKKELNLSRLNSFDNARSCMKSLFVRNMALGNCEPNDAGTMAEVKEKIRIRLGLEHGYNPIPKSRENLLQYTPKLEDLPARSMQDSYTSAIIPLSTDKELQERYVAFLGHVRLGRLMEDMDMFAVWVCHQHVKVPMLPPEIHLPYTFVTILVDKADFTGLQTTISEDIRLSGHMSWVGRTSMEVDVWLEQLNDGVYRKITRALFLMAARNATNTGSAPVNPLVPATENERQILAGGEDRKKRRQMLQASSLFKVEPNAYEQTLMYNIFKRTTSLDSLELNRRFLPSNCRWMSDSFVVNTMASFPEDRNAHNTVFGGYLMKNALEISWVGAYIFSKSRPILAHISDISFERPVSVSSFIKMTAYVVYTELNYVQVMTVADILDAMSDTQETSNVFYYTFKTADKVKEVLPRTYHETMWYLQGRRKFRNYLNLD